MNLPVDHLESVRMTNLAPGLIESEDDEAESEGASSFPELHESAPVMGTWEHTH